MACSVGIFKHFREEMEDTNKYTKVHKHTHTNSSNIQVNNTDMLNANNGKLLSLSLKKLDLSTHKMNKPNKHHTPQITDSHNGQHKLNNNSIKQKYDPYTNTTQYHYTQYKKKQQINM